MTRAEVIIGLSDRFGSYVQQFAYPWVDRNIDITFSQIQHHSYLQISLQDLLVEGKEKSKNIAKVM